jgi:hypothetical protein
MYKRRRNLFDGVITRVKDIGGFPAWKIEGSEASYVRPPHDMMIHAFDIYSQETPWKEGGKYAIIDCFSTHDTEILLNRSTVIVMNAPSFVQTCADQGMIPVMFRHFVTKVITRGRITHEATLVLLGAPTVFLTEMSSHGKDSTVNLVKYADPTFTLKASFFSLDFDKCFAIWCSPHTTADPAPVLETCYHFDRNTPVMFDMSHTWFASQLSTHITDIYACNPLESSRTAHACTCFILIALSRSGAHHLLDLYISWHHMRLVKYSDPQSADVSRDNMKQFTSAIKPTSSTMNALAKIVSDTINRYA